MFFGAIARSRVLKAKDVPLAYSKWWKKIRPVKAEVGVCQVAKSLGCGHAFCTRCPYRLWHCRSF
jgi:hypothetical protein